MAAEPEKRIDELQREIEELEALVSAKRQEISEIQQRKLDGEK